MDLHLNIIGSIMIMLALIHVIFPRYFNWGSELKLLSPINRQMMLVHTFFVALMVLLMGLLCLCCSKDLRCSALGSRIALGMTIFWLCRLVIQFFGYSSELWRGKRKETFIHWVFVGLWLYFSIVFLMVFFEYQQASSL